jgi:hypothetical protein
MTCIVDFTGRFATCGLPTSFWADWDQKRELLVFGGDWAEVPDMPAKIEPTRDEAYAWARQHGSCV